MSPLLVAELSLIAIVGVLAIAAATHARRLAAIELELSILRSRLTAAGLHEDTDRRW